MRFSLSMMVLLKMGLYIAHGVVDGLLSSPMMNCETCHYWVEEHQWLSFRHSGDRRLCSYVLEGMGLACIEDPSSEHCTPVFITHKDFGCVAHDPRSLPVRTIPPIPDDNIQTPEAMG